MWRTEHGRAPVTPNTQLEQPESLFELDLLSERALPPAELPSHALAPPQPEPSVQPQTVTPSVTPRAPGKAEPRVARREASTNGPDEASPSTTSPPRMLALREAESAPAPDHTPLSLEQLGYGTPHAAALQPYLHVDATASAQNRLDQNLAQAIVDSDRDRSNGVEGPITHAIHLAAMAVVVPTSLSKIAVIVGSNGKLADVRVISTNRDARALANFSARLSKLLADKTIRVPNGRAMEFIYEIKSDVQLPSGRAPGLGVEVLGMPLKQGRAENSSKLSILTPKLKFESVSQPDPERNGKVTQIPPQVVIGMSVLGVDADLVDLGAKERQVVHTRLIEQHVL